MFGRQAACNGGRPRDEPLQLVEFGCGPGFSQEGRFEYLRVLKSGAESSQSSCKIAGRRDEPKGKTDLKAQSGNLRSKDY